MRAFVLADSVIRCEWRKLERLASRSPLAVGIAVVLGLGSPIAAYVLGGLAAPRLSVVTSGAGIATQLVFGAALAGACVAAAFALRMRSISVDLPQIVAGSGSRVRVILGARVLPVLPVTALGSIAGAVALARIGSASPGGWSGGLVWALASGLIALLSLTCAAAARTERSLVLVATVLAATAVWVTVGKLVGTGAAAGPAGVAGRALAGDGATVSIAAVLGGLLLASAWSAVVLLANAPQRHVRLATTPSRRLPAGASQAVAAAALFEALRSSHVRRPVLAGLLLAAVGPLAIGGLTEVPPFVTLLLAGATAALAVAALPQAIRDAGRKAAQLAGRPPGASVRLTSLVTCFGLSAIPLAAVVLITGARGADLVLGGRSLVIGLLAGAVASRLVPPAIDAPIAHYTVYGVVTALLAVMAGATGPAGAAAFAVLVVVLIMFIPDRRTVVS